MSDSVITIPLDFTSYDGHTRINAKLWTSPAFGTPEDPGPEKPKAIIQIVHGMAEYIDRYDDLASYFVGRGFIVCAEDHLGHGGSVESPNDYGHIPMDGKLIILNDVDKLRRIVSECFPGIPYVMYGHSMGSFMVRSYTARAGEGLAAAVMTGTGNVPAALSKLGRTMARTFGRVRGQRFRSKMIDGMGAGAYNDKIINPRTKLDWLSTDPETVDAYIADPKCGFMFTVGGYATLLELTAEVVTMDCAARVPRDLPCLFASGDQDPVGDNGAGVRAAAALLVQAGVEVVDCILYPGMRHEIHNEIGREQVYKDIADWIEENAHEPAHARSAEEVQAVISGQQVVNAQDVEDAEDVDEPQDAEGVEDAQDAGEVQAEEPAQVEEQAEE